MTVPIFDVEEWLKIYRKFSDSDLEAEITWLRGQSRNIYNAQTEGQRSYARSTIEIRDRLSAALEAQSERTQSTESRHGVADFSGI